MRGFIRTPATRWLALGSVLLAGGIAGCGGDDAEQAASGGDGGGEEVKVGLITKTDTNPFFVKMKEGADATMSRR